MATPNRYATRPRSAPAVTRPNSTRHGTSARRTAPPSPPANRKPWLLAGATLMSLAMGAAAINYVTKPDPDAPQAGCVIAEDTQGTTKDMAATYKSWLADQVKGCAKADRAAVDIVLVTSETRTGTTTPVSLNLRDDIEYTGNTDNDGELVDDAIDDLVADAEPNIFNAPRQKAGGTDLIGVVCVASDLFAGRADKTLIINTDGMNDRLPYRLRAVNLGSEAVQRYVSEIVATWPPDCTLAGAKVLMYGTGIGSGTEKLTAEQLLGVEAFWRALFAAAGAEVVTYQRNP